MLIPIHYFAEGGVNMKKKKVLRGALAVMLCFLLSTQALAASIAWDLAADGDLFIEESGNTYDVTGGTAEAPTSNTITVAEDVTDTTINLNGVHIAASDESAIDVGDYTDVTLNVNGENTVTSDTNAAIHVEHGDLTITSETGGVLNASNMGPLDEEGYPLNYTDSAAIGSDEGEDMNGSITISGNVVVNAESNNDGAAIGAGQAEVEYDEETGEAVAYIGGNMDGTITIQDNAVVDAYSGSDGAGIGSGMYGSMDGEIVIQDNATVTAFSEDDGAGIGSGDNGDMGGEITISGGTVTATGDDEGAGIGSGEAGYMMGTITISGGTVTAISEDDGAGIGSGEGEYEYYYDEETNTEYSYLKGGDMTGTINITGGTVTAFSEDEGAGIGAGYNGDLRGEITISGGTVDAESDSSGAGIGAGEYGSVSGEIHISGDADVEARSNDGAGIGAGEEGEMNGTISITEKAQVTAESELGADIGFGDYGQLGEDAKYVIGTGTTINGASGGNVEALKDSIEFKLDENGQPANLTIQKEKEEEEVDDGSYTYVLHTESEKVKAVLHAADGPVKLLEQAVAEDAAALLTKGVQEEDLLLLTELSFDKEHGGWFTLWFRLGKEFAGKRVEIRWLEDGELVTKTVTVNVNGNAGLSGKQLGSFAVVLAK